MSSKDAPPAETWKEDITALKTWEEFDEYFQKTYIDSELASFKSGCTYCVVNEQGVVHRKEFGSHKPDTLYLSYSVTKIVTTIATLQLRDAGKINLDDLISKHIPSWKDGERETEEGVTATAATIKQALNHTSGISGNFMANPTMSPHPQGSHTASMTVCPHSKRAPTHCASAHDSSRCGGVCVHGVTIWHTGAHRVE